MAKIPPKPDAAVQIENVNTELLNILKEPDAELLFAVTIYKGQVIGSVNAKIKLTEQEINKIVETIVRRYHGSGDN